MIYEIIKSLSEFSGASLISYISVRAACATIFAFVFAVVIGRPAIARLKRLGLEEDVVNPHSEKLTELSKAKQNTPTMGGVFVVGAMLTSCVLWMRFDGFNQFSLWGLLLIAWFAVVGLWDDWIKLRVPGRKGMSAKSKQLLLTVGSVAVALVVVHHGGLESSRGGPHLYFPFIKDYSWDLTVMGGIPFLVIATLVLTGSANAVNLTDGMDGLAVGCIAMAAIAFAGITYFVGHESFADYLLVQHVAGSGELTVMLGALLGASLGFLWYNAAPAQVFMGDVGSLALGGALGYAALISRTELVLLVVGGVFVAEAVSVMIQVVSYKTTGRRVFRCAPLHHHFQFAGMPETRVVVRIWVVAALLALSSLVLFKVR